MKRIVKSLCLTVFSFAVMNNSNAQSTGASTASFTNDIKKIIRDYPHQFTHLQGDVMNENPQTIDYDCNFLINGAETSMITRYSSGKKSIYSWQAVMLTTDDFEEAKKKFKSLYSQFNHMAVRMDYGDTFYLSGRYEAPVEEKKFASAVLTFEKADALTRKMKVEVSMQYELMEWKVKVLIYERDREDTERGEIEE